MRFETKEDIEVPIEALFDMLADFEWSENAALRRGAELQRTDRLREPGPGMTWDTRFMMRGRMREMEIVLTKFERPEDMHFETTSQSMNSELIVHLIALSKKRTRLHVVAKLAPKTLAARLMVQSFKLARSSINRKFHARVSEYAKSLEARYMMA